MGKGSVIEGNDRFFPSDATVEAFRAVKLDGGDIEHAGSTEEGEVIGWTQYQDDRQNEPDKHRVRLRNAGGTVLWEVAGEVTAPGILLYVAANGRGTPTQGAALFPVAISLEAATGANSVIEVMPITWQTDDDS
jgi:hypothetical protein